jgi:hypothetical protein
LPEIGTHVVERPPREPKIPTCGGKCNSVRALQSAGI